MNWYSVFSVRSVMGVALVMAGLAHAADVKLSETTELQAGGDLTYTFASGDTFVVDAAFAPTSFKPICLGDFTMKVEGTGSVAATTQLDFSAVTGALTLSGLGTTESSLPKQTSTAIGTVAATASEEPAPAAASTESASEPATEESAPALVAEDTATLTFAPVLLTAEAVEVRLSETVALQGEGDLTYTFEEGATFVVDAPFSPTSFAPTCSGDFTMKVVSGGSVADTTALNFSGVTGVLTLSGLGTTEARLPAPTFASGKTVNLESCWFSTLALTTTSAANMAYNVSGTGALGSLTAADSRYATLNLSGTQEITTIASPYQSGIELLTVKVNEGASVTVTGDYDAGCSNLTVNGVMTCEGNFKTNRRTYQSTSVSVPEGGQLVVEKDFLHGNGYNANPYLYVKGGEVKVTGAFIRNCSGQSKGTVSIDSGLLQVGALQDKNTTNGLPFGNKQAGTATCLLTGGTLEVLNGPWTSTAAIFQTKGTTVKVGADISMGIAWVLEADMPLIVAEGKTLTFTNTITSDGVALDLADNLGTVSLGSNRPQLKAVGGSIKVSPTVDEVVAGQVPLSVTDAVTSIEGTAWQVEGWEAVTATLDSNAHQVILSSSKPMPKLVLSSDGTWTNGAWEDVAAAPTSGSAEVTTEVNATLTIDTDVALDALCFDVGAGKTLTVKVEGQDASLAVAQTIVKSGKVIVQGGTYGAVTIADEATLLFAQDGMFSSIGSGGTVGLTTAGSLKLSYESTAVETNSSKLLLRTGTFRKEGTGSVELQTYNVSDAKNQSIEVAGGTLTFFEQGGLGTNTSMNRDRHIFNSLSVANGCTFTEYSRWGVHFAVSDNLRGEGTVSTKTGEMNGVRKFFLSGSASDFTGEINFVGTSLVFEEGLTTPFGGSATLEQGSKLGSNDKVELVVARAEGVTIAKDVTLGSGVGLDLSAGGRLSVRGAFTLSGSVPVKLPATPEDGFVLVELTGDGALASDETAAKFTGVPEGYVVKAEEQTYVLRKVTLPGVNPSAPGEADGQEYSTEAAEKLTAAAEEKGLAEVSKVLLQTKGAATASTPTVTEVNNVLGCFEGVVEADAEAKTLTIRYEFGVADIAADDSETPWNGKWQVVAKVEGPTGVAFAEGVTVAAYEVGEDGEIPENATPLSSATVGAGTNAVTLKGLVFEGLGTHGVRVRVKATK